MKTCTVMTGMLCRFLLVLVAVIGLAEAATTSVSNESRRAIRASITYNISFGQSKFSNRLIAPGTYQSGQYTEATNSVSVFIWIEGSTKKHDSFIISKDRSVVTYSSTPNCIVIYLAKYGTRTTPDGDRLGEVCF